jgi:hypothetical protein
MVMRTVFDAVKSIPKFNAMYANTHLEEGAIGWETFLLASSLITNQTYVFDNESTPSANTTMLNYMDTMIAACKLNSRILVRERFRFRLLCCSLASRWDGIDPWVASRFAKTCELVARLAAQFCHIDLTMKLLEEFTLANNVTNHHATVSFERYCALREFIHSRYPPTDSIVTINGNTYRVFLIGTGHNRNKMIIGRIYSIR